MIVLHPTMEVQRVSYRPFGLLHLIWCLSVNVNPYSSEESFNNFNNRERLMGISLAVKSNGSVPSLNHNQAKAALPQRQLAPTNNILNLEL